jgi:Protein of unknown function (DUF3565)
MQAERVGIPRTIADFPLGEDGEWVAELECGHEHQVRHSPPRTTSPRITTPQGRLEHLDRELPCLACFLAQAERTQLKRTTAPPRGESGENRLENFRLSVLSSICCIAAIYAPDVG